ncbi:DUF4377 domain-containing protein [Motilimonas pumila]|uniref:DUF4377 domain-containing protein n=1 Tax=Motilimonas pumila TaxID=2303987 RepID=A0A418YC21_9GAMM|nr:DUF4377 domain-containing protein [Motilimonas pumila]RJG42008.1 DUF4377 domain-containing protein [Motilimonas pumila]
MKLFALLPAALVLAACSSAPLTSQNLMYVNASTHECDAGAGKATCMLVKTPDTQEWQSFYGQIEGFDYQPGYQYQLQVSQQKVDNPPADASSIQYSLVKVISKLPLKRID